MKNIKNFKQFESKLSKTVSNAYNEDYMELNKIYTLPSTTGEEINFKILSKSILSHRLTISIDYFSKVWFDENNDDKAQLVFLEHIEENYPSILKNVEETVINTLKDKWDTDYDPDDISVKWEYFDNNYSMYNHNESNFTPGGLAATALITTVGLGAIGFQVYDQLQDNHVLKAEHKNGMQIYSTLNLSCIKNGPVLLNTYSVKTGKSSSTTHRNVTIEDPTIKTIWVDIALFGNTRVSTTPMNDGVKININELELIKDEPGYKVYNCKWGQGIDKIMVITGNTKNNKDLYYPMELDGKQYAKININILSKAEFIVPITIMGGGELSGSGAGGDY